MIGDDLVDDAFAKGIPEVLAVVALADRWRAFELGRAVRDLLRGKREVVRAGLDGERHLGLAGGAEERQRIGRREMNDVRAGPGLLRESEHELDRGVLGAARA